MKFDEFPFYLGELFLLLAGVLGLFVPLEPVDHICVDRNVVEHGVQFV